MASDVLLENDFIRIEEHRALQVIVVRRSANRVEPAMIAAAYGEALATITPEHRSWGVVIDVRQTPGSNDAKFESAIGPVTERVGSSFARVVFLVRTAVGGLLPGGVERGSEQEAEKGEERKAGEEKEEEEEGRRGGGGGRGASPSRRSVSAASLRPCHLCTVVVATAVGSGHSGVCLRHLQPAHITPHPPPLAIPEFRIVSKPVAVLSRKAPWLYRSNSVLY